MQEFELGTRVRIADDAIVFDNQMDYDREGEVCGEHAPRGHKPYALVPVRVPLTKGGVEVVFADISGLERVDA